MTDTPRRSPYVFVTWLTKLLSGEDECQFAAWFKSTHKYAKVADDFPDRDAWVAKHDAITNRREAELIAEGYTTRKEDDAEFVLQGYERCGAGCGGRYDPREKGCETCCSKLRPLPGATLAGKPDLVGIRGDEAVVIDAKSGRPKLADAWQVRIYLFALPRTWLKGVQLRGEVERPDPKDRETVAPLTAADQQAIVALMKTVTAVEPPKAAPGPRACRYCDIASCPHRYKKPSGDVSALW